MSIRLHVVSLRRLVLSAAVLLLGLAFAPSANAQGMGGNPEERAARQVTQLTEALKLTAPQVEQVKAIVAKQTTEQSAIMQKMQGGGDRQAVMGEMQALRDKTAKAIEAVLTAEQKPVYAKFREEQDAARRARMGGGTR